MILGLYMSQLNIPVLPLIIMILSGIILIAGIAFMIFRHYFEKGESDIDPVLYKKISVIAAWVFVIYMAIELIMICACVVANDACRYGYHYDISKASCPFCRGFKVNDAHSAASDVMTLGIYFDAFIVNAFVTNSIKVIREKIDNRKKDI